ncbi:hypothetical protein [Hymenobacter armeniacus]|uniref:STAS/SEC14 domain-containing protein n=1 Tax=Hymenobacter armeniacus TaxID=2771358 RepID=A0ABR8JYE4_9BACT|nr:hypothetical protein [Hymenobacter armeniacus]MBD2723841.1 hypothetical protein [Hymenobacter armeniacus]
MYQDLASTAFLHVAYRPDSCLLIGRWLCSINDAQLREGYETMRRAAQEHQCHHWLMDARRRTDRRLNGPEWVVTTFLPQVQREMGAPLYVAFLVLPNHLREVEADPHMAEKNPSPNASFQYARFIDEGAANAWLDQKRREGQ